MRIPIFEVIIFLVYFLITQTDNPESERIAHILAFHVWSSQRDSLHSSGFSYGAHPYQNASEKKVEFKTLFDLDI